eukprot:1160825-Pelagomonas_calceolata.AAC.1
MTLHNTIPSSISWRGRNACCTTQLLIHPWPALGSTHSLLKAAPHPRLLQATSVCHTHTCARIHTTHRQGHHDLPWGPQIPRQWPHLIPDGCRLQVSVTHTTAPTDKGTMTCLGVHRFLVMGHTSSQTAAGYRCPSPTQPHPQTRAQ